MILKLHKLLVFINEPLNIKKGVKMYYWFDSKSNSFALTPIKNNSYIPQIVWVITDKCNYKCPFCFQPKNNSDIDLQLLNKNIRVCEELGVQKIDISGGEPLYFKELPKVIKKLKSHNFHLTISTNGSGLTSNQIWIASNANLFSRIIVSLNGYDEEHNDYLCGVKGAYSKFIAFLDLLKKNNCGNVRINTVITSIYLDNTHLNKIISIIKDISPYEWCLIQPHPENKQPLFDNYSITTQQFNSIANKVRMSFLGEKIRIISRNIENYAGYWILNPDGRFILHTDGLRESIVTDFSINSVSEIIYLSNKYGIWVPQDEND